MGNYIIIAAVFVIYSRLFSILAIIFHKVSRAVVMVSYAYKRPRNSMCAMSFAYASYAIDFKWNNLKKNSRKKTAHTHTFTCSTIFQAITMVMIIFYVEWCGPHFSFAIMANSRTIYISLSLSLSAVQFAFVDVECDRSHSRVLFNFSTDPVRFCHKTPNLFCRLFFVVCVCLSFSFSRSFLSSQH